MSSTNHLDHFAHGLTTPAIGYAVMVMAAVIGLMCTVRARDATGPAKRNWLITGAGSLAVGIWTLHFIAMLGFRVSGSPIRYNVSLTLISLIVAFLVVGGGVLMVGYGKDRNRALIYGGLGTGIGVAAMHYTGMASVRIDGALGYRPELVVASLAIAVAAATAALWLAFTVRSLWGALTAALVMGIAVSSMHYTGMAAVSAELAAEPGAVAGATVGEFVVPLTIGLGALLLAGFTVIAVSPVELGPPDDDEEDEPPAAEPQNLFAPPRRQAPEQRPAAGPPAAAPVRRATQPGPLPQRPRPPAPGDDPPVVQSWLTRPDPRS